MTAIVAQPLTAGGFAPFGDVLEASGPPDKLINQGLCRRFHDRAVLEFDSAGRAGVSIFDAKPRQFPYRLEMVERHPEGAQCFVPMHQNPWLVVAAEPGREPGPVHAFLAAPGQAINFHRGTWHGVLTPLDAPGLFAVIDRIGPGDNLEEFWFDTPLIITAPD